jgi:hypothetical protein
MKRQITDPSELRELNQMLAQALALYLKQLNHAPICGRPRTRAAPSRAATKTRASTAQQIIEG